MRRRVGFLFICSAAIPIAIFASAAWACGAYTTASATPKVAAPNQTITVSGRNYGAAPNFGPVQIRWNSRTGPVLQELPPTSGSSFAFTTNVQVPASTIPGWYLVAVTQYRISDGTAKSGSPGRTTVRVQGAAAGSTAPWGAANPTGSGGPGSPDLPLPGILLSVALLGTGLALVARGRGKKATRPVLGV